MYPELWEEAINGSEGSIGTKAIGSYSAWAWGVSRLIDGLELTKDQHGIDLTKIGVTGCSYGGKMALWAGALDERIALTIAEESGGGGAPAWRTSEDMPGDAEDIDSTNWAWFKDSLQTRKPHQLPHDHHELVAMAAPRAFIGLPGDPGNSWLGPESAAKSITASRKVWKAMGVEDHAGMVVHNNGGRHCSPSSKQKEAAISFLFCRGQNRSPSNHYLFCFSTRAQAHIAQDRRGRPLRTFETMRDQLSEW